MQWSPELARLYGFKPWEMDELTPHESRLISRHLTELQRQEGG